MQSNLEAGFFKDELKEGLANTEACSLIQLALDGTTTTAK
jgi:hypothetical protein